MSHSTDPNHFFQTDASEAIRARRAAKSGNKNGNPIKLQSKILDVVVDPLSTDCLYVAESAGCIRKINIDVGEPLRITPLFLHDLDFSMTDYWRNRLKTPKLFTAAQRLRSPLWLLADTTSGQYLQDVGIKIFGAGTGRRQH